MKNVNYVLENYGKLSGTKLILFMAVLLSVNLGYSQEEYFNYGTLVTDVRHDHTYYNIEAHWIDDDVSAYNGYGLSIWRRRQ
ncbi:hypothetical protein [Flavobacterium poyangense]|uniref:hypothetical protein n=1 Tax=Flavobacterium poyangense TaxID=2204302 RepID=UPI00141E9928|nr:hypothetical protein [Flavobacterium sp. JXAS1]